MNRSRTVFACCIVLTQLLSVGRSNEASDKKVTTAKAPDDVQTAEALTLDLGKGVTMKLALVPAGKFLMGSNAHEILMGANCPVLAVKADAKWPETG